MKRLLLVFLLLLPLLSGKAYAEDTMNRSFRIFDASQVETGLSEEERNIGGAIRADGYDVGSALIRLWESFLGVLREQIHEELDFAVRLLALVFLCALSCTACPDIKICAMIEICSVWAAAVHLIGSMSGLVNQTCDAIFRLSDYAKAAMPAVYTAAAASGSVSSAAIGYAWASLALNTLMNLSQSTVIPLVYATLSLSLADVVFPNPMLTAMGKFTKWAAKTILTGTTLVFTAGLGMSTLISTKVDAAAVKTARTVISGTLPVVGGMISDASAAVLSAGAAVLSCMGAFGLIAVCAMCMGPFVMLTVKGMVFKAVCTVAESVQNSGLQRLFSGVSAAVGLLMGLLGANAIMLFLSLAAAMKVVT